MPYANRKQALTHKSFFPARSMDEPFGTTDPSIVHGPSRAFAEAYLTFSCVLKRKYSPSSVLRTRPGSRTLQAPVQGRGLGNPWARAPMSSGITARKRDETILSLRASHQSQKSPMGKKHRFWLQEEGEDEGVFNKGPVRIQMV